MKLKKNEDQSVVILPLRIGNKTSMEGVTETKFGAERKGWTLETATSGDPSHNQPPNPDTIAYASKILLKGPCYSCLV